MDEYFWPRKSTLFMGYQHELFQPAASSEQNVVKCCHSSLDKTKMLLKEPSYSRGQQLLFHGLRSCSVLMWRKGAAISISALTCGILSQQLTTRVNAGVYFILVDNSRELRILIEIDLHSHYSCWWLITACSCFSNKTSNFMVTLSRDQPVTLVFGRSRGGPTSIFRHLKTIFVRTSQLCILPPYISERSCCPLSGHPCCKQAKQSLFSNTMSSLTGCCFRAAESGPQYALTTSPKHLRVLRNTTNVHL
ncbi:hypothetical protein T06_11133 [Trichinella sp. T6]|nr:hypothetical protein T06_11133 [Trichinella sp. T6]